jgi:GT2 family glycosyltransferase
MPRFDVVIPTYNNRLALERCLAGLAQQSFQDFHVWVCVDGSTDDTQAWLQAHQAAHAYPFAWRVLTHPDGQNHGRNATRNLSLPHLTAPHWLTLDSDCEPLPDTLAAHAALLDEAGQLAHQTVSVGEVHYSNARTDPWAQYLAWRGKGLFAHGQTMPWRYFVSPNTATPTQWVLAIGGQDAQMGYGSDAEFGYRLWQACPDLRFVCNQHAAVQTLNDKSVDFGLRQLRQFGATSLRYIHRKHPECPNIYRLPQLTGHDWRSRAFRLLLPPFGDTLARIAYGVLPRRWRRYALHYRVAWHIAAGFLRDPD